MFIFTVGRCNNSSCITACHLCNTYFIAACLQLPHSEIEYNTVNPDCRSWMWTFSGAPLSFMALCSVQWVRCWLIFSEWLSNWPVWHIVTASHSLIQYYHGNKAFNLHYFFLKSWKDSFHLLEAKPTPSHLCLPLFLSLSPSLSDPPPPA